ncbi:CCNB protein, partial [Atractosteus spatula]|nr:CCNB protein [Atractosteus spatula]
LKITGWVGVLSHPRLVTAVFLAAAARGRWSSGPWSPRSGPPRTRAWVEKRCLHTRVRDGRCWTSSAGGLIWSRLDPPETTRSRSSDTGAMARPNLCDPKLVLDPHKKLSAVRLRQQSRCPATPGWRAVLLGSSGEELLTRLVGLRAPLSLSCLAGGQGETVGARVAVLVARLLPQLEEKRAPLKSWANTSMGKDRRQQEWIPSPLAQSFLSWTSEPGFVVLLLQARRPDMAMDCIEENGYRHAVSLWLTDERGTDTTILLQYGLLDMAPSLLMRDMEVAMEKLGLTFVKIYALDIFCDMMRKQSSYALQSPELPSGFTSCTRAILVDSLIQVHDAFHYSEETLYLTVHLLNRCMRSCRVSIATFQLLGMACLFIASKREECLLPEVSELCFLMENTYSKKQLLRMERHVLKELKYDLSYCYPLHFLLLSGTITRYSAQGPAHSGTQAAHLRVTVRHERERSPAVGSGEGVLWMARYFLELTLLEPQCVVFQPVQLAGAALCLACRVLQGQLFPASERACQADGCSLSRPSRSERTAQRIMHYIARLVMRAGASETQATFLKFSSVTRLQVSLHPCLQSVLPLLGLL